MGAVSTPRTRPAGDPGVVMEMVEQLLDKPETVRGKDGGLHAGVLKELNGKRCRT